MYKSHRKPYRKDTYNAFVKWNMMTTKQRKAAGVPTAKAFAEKYNIGEDRLSKWKKRPGFHKHVEKGLIEQMRDMSSDVWASFMDRLKKYGHRNEMELFLLYVEGWSKEGAYLQSLEKAKDVPLEPNDIRSLIATLPEEKQKKYYGFLAELLADLVQEEHRKLEDL